MKPFYKNLSLLVCLAGLLAVTVWLTACTPTPPAPASVTPTVTLAIIFTATPTPIPPTPTATPEPLAARINGAGLLLNEFDAELARYRQSGVDLAGQAGLSPEQFVMKMMIEERLLAQSAAQQGYAPTDADVQERLVRLAGQVDLPAWMSAHGYDEASLKIALRYSMQAAWMRDQISASLPTSVEQVHALQILLYNSGEANQVYGLVQGGKDFPTLAQQYNPTTGGEMGWFPRGYLTYPALEEAAFGLQAGEYSQIVQTTLGYHILYLVERQADRPLNGEAMRTLQSGAITEWLKAQRLAAQVEILIPAAQLEN